MAHIYDTGRRYVPLLRAPAAALTQEQHGTDRETQLPIYIFIFIKARNFR